MVTDISDVFSFLDATGDDAGDSVQQDFTTNLTVENQPSLQAHAVSSGVDLKSPELPLQASVSSQRLTISTGRIFLEICSGVTRPLSKAVLHLGGDVLSFDILLRESMDLLRDDVYDTMSSFCESAQLAR